MRDNACAMDEDELELLITVVVGADDAHRAQSSCGPLLERAGGRVVSCADCSDEEPGCWSVTISRAAETSGTGQAALSRAVRNFLRELGIAHPRVSCEPPTAWAVLDDPDVVGGLVGGGERVLVEAWAGGPATAGTSGPDEVAVTSEDAAEEAADGGADTGDVDEDGLSRSRLGLLVDVVTERRSGAEWPARALASRLARTPEITDCAERPPVVRITLDLGPAAGEPEELVSRAASRLGGGGWTRPSARGAGAMMRWTAAPTPPSGIAAIELVASAPGEPTDVSEMDGHAASGAGGRSPGAHR